MDQAGIRLAGELNKLFNSATPSVVTAPPVQAAAVADSSIISLEDIK
jgi:hypothetical protein